LRKSPPIPCLKKHLSLTDIQEKSVREFLLCPAVFCFGFQPAVFRPLGDTLMIIKIVLFAFIFLETSNVLALYFAPGSKRANAVGVFSAWEKSKQFPEIHDFVKYLVYWVAGAKLIFLLLLVVIVLFGDATLQRFILLALAIGTVSFYWRLFPLIRSMDRNGQIEPHNYSTKLGWMILGLIIVFLLGAFL
jgi:hypothetical protein